jgi:hypothetical protein
MSTANKRAPPFLDDDDDSSPKAENSTSRSIKHTKLETSLDVHESRIILEDEDTNLYSELDNINRRASLAASSNEATLNFMKAKIIDLEAKLSQMQGQAPVSGETAPAPFLNGDESHFDNGMPELHQLDPEVPPANRKPAKPMLNRVPWVPFKNFYPDEDSYAIDVLMVLKTIPQ